MPGGSCQKKSRTSPPQYDAPAMPSAEFEAVHETVREEQAREMLA